MRTVEEIMTLIAPCEAAVVQAKKEALGVLTSGAKRHEKINRLIELAERAVGAVLPSTPCKKGCGACCHIAAAITEREAERIGKHVGRAPQVITGSLHDNIMNARKDYYGVPCTFLGAEKECTIYEVRPMTCRVHHSLNQTAAECEPMPGEADKPIVPQVDLETFRIGVAIVDIDRSVADIRDYFPPT